MGFSDWIERLFVSATVLQTAYSLYAILKEFLRKKRPDATISSVLFFPDEELLRQTYQRTRDIRKLNRKLDQEAPNAGAISRLPQHPGVTALDVIVRYIRTSQQTIDVCVFTITCYELARAVVDVHTRGVIVRVVTDNEQILCSGSQVPYFRREGIQVRHDDSSFYMHHKFMIIDRRTLINGSFNWTRNAVTGNRENVMIIEGGTVTERYKEEFERLWHEFNPDTRKQY